jgi:protein-S-isoprenylcysteine O-methyltransferase Ste14
MIDSRDNAGVVAPPPLLALAAIALGLALDRLAPAYLIAVLLPTTARLVIGAILGAAGLALMAAAMLAFHRAGTRPEPWKPTVAIVTTGVYGFMRNPMYVGGTLVLVGLALALASDWMAVMTIVFALVVHFGVVRREERYLEAKFGDAYRRYKARVPRYGWPA